MRKRRFMLVYQSGTATLFRVRCFNLAPYGREAVRVYQGDFHTAEALAHGAWLAGAAIKAAVCNRAGDIAQGVWSEDFDSAPSRDAMRPPLAYAHGR